MMGLREDQAKLEADKEKVKLQALRDEADLKAVLSTPAGKRFYQRLLIKCRIYQTSFDSDPLRMAKNEGTREVGIWLEQSLWPHPELYCQLFQRGPIDDIN